MFRIFVLAIFAMVLALLTSVFCGCGGGSAGASGEAVISGGAGNYNITVTDPTGEWPPKFWVYDQTWDGYPTKYVFGLKEAGHRAVPNASFELYKSSFPTNSNDPVADLAGFTQLQAKYGPNEIASYTFTDGGRYLIKSYVNGQLVSFARLQLSWDYFPTQ